MTNQFNLLFPEWQGYGAHQEVFHGAQHFCKHVTPALKFNEVVVGLEENLHEEYGIVGRSSLLNMLDQASAILKAAQPRQLFMMGGTCACEVAPISFLNEQYDNDLAIFWFDAHGDLNTPQTSPSHRMHGMPLRTLLGEGDEAMVRLISKCLDKSQVALVGARDLDEEEEKFIRRSNIPIFKPNQVSNVSELVDFARTAGFKKAYIHFDLDVLEPEEFSHTLLQVPDGLSISNAIASLQQIRKHFDVVGCSIVEYCPKDGGGTTQLGSLVSNGLGIKL